jgi:hypothetical protein
MEQGKEGRSRLARALQLLDQYYRELDELERKLIELLQECKETDDGLAHDHVIAEADLREIFSQLRKSFRCSAGAIHGVIELIVLSSGGGG